MPYKDRDKNLAYHREYSKKNGRNKRLKEKFGLTPEQYDTLVLKQHGVCAICHKPETTIHGGSKQLMPLGVDHNHKTGKVRELLCTRCNTALGLIDDSPERALALATYLEKHAELDKVTG